MGEIEEILLGEKAREKIVSGINKLSNAVKVTFGPYGKNVIILDENNKPYLTKDGVSVSNSVYLKDTYENIGAGLIKEVAQKTVEEAGDGTTQSIILAQSILNKAIKKLNNGIHPNKIKKSILSIKEEVLKLLKLKSKPLLPNDIYNVLMTSSNSDLEISEILNKAFIHSSNIEIKEGNNINNEIEFTNGSIFNTTFHSKIFIENKESNKTKLENTLCLVLNYKLTNLKYLEHIIKYCNENEESLVIFTEFISDNILRILETNQINKSLNILPLKAPGVGHYRRQYLEDISSLANCSVIENNKYNIQLSDLGRIKTISTSLKNTLIIPSDKSLIDKRFSFLNKQLKNKELEDYDKEVINKRIENLRGNVVIIKVGGKSEIEIKEKYDRMDDAVKAVKSALEEGVVPGAGRLLLEISDKLYKIYNFKDNILLESIKEPYNIINNSNNELDLKNVIDPTKVIRCALENAVSVVTTILTTDAIVLNHYKWN